MSAPTHSPPIERVAFFVDGFNLYHSISTAENRTDQHSLKWLDLPKLFAAHLDQISPQARCESIYYYSAYATHLQEKDPAKIARHKAYVRALTASGVIFIKNHFKRKTVYAPKDDRWLVTFEEKETDVAIAVDLLEGASNNAFDTAVIVSGDTDLRPAALAFQRMFPDKLLIFGFPYDRKNKDLAKIVPRSFTFSADAYLQHQFPDKVRLPSNKYVYKPEVW